MDQSILILDGGMSRELIRIGAPFHQPEWSALALIEAPHFVQQVHEEFALAGADIITTNSYALVPFHIGEERFWKQGLQLAALAGKLARDAADAETRRSGRKVLVAGSLPPIFGSYEPALFEKDNVQKYLSVLVEGLSPYVDIWLGETLSLIAEAEAVEIAVKDTGKPFWIAFTIEDRTRSPDDTPCLRSGETVTDAARWILKSSAASMLFNCSQPEFMVASIRSAQAVFRQGNRSVPVGVYANAFESESTSEEGAANAKISATRDDLDNSSYISFAQKWVDQGVSIVGGCCGIGCDHIKGLAHGLRTNRTYRN